MIEVQICDYCRSCNIDTLENTNLVGFVFCNDCEKLIENSAKETVLVEKECVDCGVDTDYKYKH